MGLVNIWEAARSAGLADKTLRRAVKDGTLKAQPRARPNDRIMIDVDDLNAYLRNTRGVQVEQVKAEPAPVVEEQPRLTKDQIKISVLEDKVIECLLALKHMEERLQKLEESRHDVQTVEDKRSQDVEQRMQGIEKRLQALEKAQATIPGQSVQGGQAQVVDASAQPVKEKPRLDASSYQDEWRITGDGTLRYHDIDGSRTRNQLDTYVRRSPKTKWELHPPMFTPSSGLATEVTQGLPDGVRKQLKLSTGEMITFREDFTQPDLVGYHCEATHRDVEASLWVIPHRESEQGTYMIGQRRWGKTNPIGREGPKQVKRAQTLLATLEDRTRLEMRKAGWVEVGQSDDPTPVTLWRLPSAPGRMSDA
jgi:hypothetical protein